jgi:hypothetical protein
MSASTIAGKFPTSLKVGITTIVFGTGALPQPENVDTVIDVKSKLAVQGWQEATGSAESAL